MGEKNKKVLFLRFSSLGDVILANFYALKIKEKNPAWQLTWIVDSMYKEIVISQPWVDDVIIWDRKKDGNKGFIKAIKEVRSRGFDILIDMHNTDRSSFFSFFSNIPQRFTDRYRIPFAHNVHSLDSLFDNTDNISDCPKYLYAPPATDRIRRLLLDATHKPVITAAIGASYEKKRWPVNNWIDFCRMAVASGYYINITGDGPEEEDNAHVIATSVGDKRLNNLAGELSVAELVQVIDKSQIVISGDTGAVHIARALGKETIVMFGPSSINNVSYVDSLKNVFYCNCENKGCHNFKCSMPCMETISPVMIYDRLEVLNKNIREDSV